MLLVDTLKLMVTTDVVFGPPKETMRQAPSDTALPPPPPPLPGSANTTAGMPTSGGGSSGTDPSAVLQAPGGGNSTASDETELTELTIYDIKTTTPEPIDSETEETSTDDGAAGPPEPNDTIALADINGGEIQPQDWVRVHWAGDEQSYTGQIINMMLNPDEGEPNLRVWYPEDNRLENHLIDDDLRATIELTVDPGLPRTTTLSTLALATTGARAPIMPHHSIKRFINMRSDGTFDIKPELLLGQTELPPGAALPTYELKDEPKIPKSILKALSGDEAEYWLRAIVKESVGHYAPPDRAATYELTHGDNATTPKRCVWAFRRKFEEGIIAKFKAREALDGSSEIYGQDYWESYIGTAPVSDIRRLDNLALQCGWSTADADWTQAYCQHSKSPRPAGGSTIMIAPPGVRIFDNETNRPYKRLLKQELYGGHSAGTTHFNKVADSLMNRNIKDGAAPCPFNIEQCPYQPTIFVARFPAYHQYANEHLIMYLHNDNLRTWTTNWAIYIELRQWLTQRWNITGTDTTLQQQGRHTLLGTTVEYFKMPDGRNAMAYSMPEYIAHVVQKYNANNWAPSDSPMTAGFSLSKHDEPTTESEKKEVVNKVNKMFNYDLHS